MSEAARSLLLTQTSNYQCPTFIRHKDDNRDRQLDRQTIQIYTTHHTKRQSADRANKHRAF